MDLQKEKQLVELAKKDPLAFGQLYDFYYPKIINYLFRRVGNIQIAEDITSETFFKTMNSLHTFRWQGVSFSSWLYKIATNEMNSFFRKKNNKLLSLDLLFQNNGYEVQDNQTVEENYFESEDKKNRYQEFRKIQKLLLELPSKYQDVLSLRFFENKKTRVIAQIMGKNQNTVKSLLKRGVHLLRKQYLANKQKTTETMQPFWAKSVLSIEEKTYED